MTLEQDGDAHEIVFVLRGCDDDVGPDEDVVTDCYAAAAVYVDAAVEVEVLAGDDAVAVLQVRAGEDEGERFELFAEEFIEQVSQRKPFEAREIAKYPGDVFLEE